MIYFIKHYISFLQTFSLVDSSTHLKSQLVCESVSRLITYLKADQ